jgi:hypothetical protein
MKKNLLLPVLSIFISMLFANPTPAENRIVALTTNSPAPKADIARAAPSSAGSAVSLVLDDGTKDTDVGIGGNRELLFLNQFSLDATNFPFTLNEIHVYFSGGASNLSVGDKIQLVIYTDKDGDPANGATFVASYAETIQTLDDWNVFTLPTSVDFMEPTDILLGVIAMETPGSAYYPAALDDSDSQKRSWVGWWTTSPPPDPPVLPPDDMWTLIDDVGFPGNFLIRGYGVSKKFPWVMFDHIFSTDRTE